MSSRRDIQSAAAPHERAAAQRRKTPSWRKFAFALFTTAIFFAAVELLLALCGVRAGAQKSDPYVGFSSHAPLYVASGGGENPAMRTAENKLVWFNEQSFPRRKAKGAYRIFCLGGSTTYGRPYNDVTSFCGWLRELLPAADSSRRWEVINAGGISYASYRVARVMEELLEYEPDLFIVYTGHNEFLEERTYRDFKQTPDSLRRLGALLSNTRTYSAARRLVRGQGQSAPEGNRPMAAQNLLPAEVNAVLDSAVGPDAYHRDDRLRRQIVEHFELNLNRMVDMARGAGAEIIFVTPASNLRDCSPFRSEHSAEVTGDDRLRWQDLYDRARRAFTLDEYDEATALLDEAALIDSRRADLYYLRGRALLTMERPDDARADLQRALEEDVCPLRAPEALRRCVARTAEARRVPLVDFAEFIASSSKHRIPGEEQFLDHVHPTIQMHRELALQLVEAMARRRLVQPSAAWGEEAIDEVAQRIEQRIDERAHATALKNLSKVLGWAGKDDEAARLALRALPYAPGDPETQYQAGNAYLRQRDFARARECFELAEQLDSPSAAIEYGLGLAHSGLGDVARALEHYKLSVRLDPEFADAHFNLANLLELQGDVAGAAAHYERVVEIIPRDEAAHINLGVLRALQRRGDEAQSHFQQALHINPQSADALVNLGRLYADRSQLDLAIEHYQRALQFAPQRQDIADLLDGAQQQLRRDP